VNSIDQTKAPATEFLFITLTYPVSFPTASASKKDLDTFIKAFERAYEPRAMIWKLEPQRRGAPHYHLLVRFRDTTDQMLADFTAWVAATWHRIGGAEDPNHLKWHLGELGNGNTPCVEKVRDWKGVSNYAGKYLGKVHHPVDRKTGEVLGDWTHSGRYWGVRRKDDLPIEIMKEDVSRVEAVRVRRWAIAWYERQPAPRFYVPGKNGHPGQSVLGNCMVDLHGWGDEHSMRSSVAEISRMMDVEVRAQPRRWSSSRGGCSMFMPADAFMRLIDLAKSSVAGDRRS
jgi:hypothetical protein